MRQLTISRHPHADTPEGTREQSGQLDTLLLRCAALSSTGLSPEAAVLQPLIDGNARFAASLANQYRNQGVSQETLITIAHRALVAVPNQYAHRQDKLHKVLVIALRNAMATAIQARAGGPR